MAKKPWDGRFSQSTDKMVEQFTSSIAVDRELYNYDIDGSIAHLKMMARRALSRRRMPGCWKRGWKRCGKRSRMMRWHSPMPWKTSTCTCRRCALG